MLVALYRYYSGKQSVSLDHVNNANTPDPAGNTPMTEYVRVSGLASSIMKHPLYYEYLLIRISYCSIFICLRASHLRHLALVSHLPRINNLIEVSKAQGQIG